MSNIIDYIKWRGDLSFDQAPINEIDNIILARFSYLPFKYIELNNMETIESISNKMKDFDIERFLWDDDKEFIKLLGQVDRYKNLKTTNYIEIFDKYMPIRIILDWEVSIRPCEFKNFCKITKTSHTSNGNCSLKIQQYRQSDNKLSPCSRSG